ncbi:MAG: cell division protein SepF [Candidatus Aenigmatarchaeota archaeon]
MGLIDSFLSRIKKGGDEHIEIPEEEEGKKEVIVRVETLRDFVDTDRISRLVKDGNIVFVKTAEIQRHDLGEFKNSVEKLKRNCRQFGWDIVGVEEGYLILTPPFAKVER